MPFDSRRQKEARPADSPLTDDQFDVAMRLADRLAAAKWHPSGEHFSNTQPTDKFNMRRVRFPCGTPACILGHLEGVHFDVISGLPISVRFASDLLGLSARDADELFVPEHDYAHYLADLGTRSYISPQRAAAVVRHYARTGNVDWSVT